METTSSARSAASRGDEATATPRASAFSRVRFQTTSSWPASRTRAAMRHPDRARSAPGDPAQARSTARRGPARKPASTSSGMTSVSVTGSPSKRSTASRFAPPCLTNADERRERRAEPVLVRLAERDERAAAALDEERRLAAEQDDVRARDARRAGARALRPRDHGAVRLRRVGGGEDERLRPRRPRAAAAPVAARRLRRARTARRRGPRRSSRAGTSRASRAPSARRRPRRSRRGSPPPGRRRA